MNKETPFDVIFNRLYRHLKDTRKIDTIYENLKRHGSDDFQRMLFLLKLESVCDIVQIPPEIIVNVARSKSAHKSNELRNDGNRLFREKKYEEAILRYTQSLSQAPIRTNESEPNENDCAALAYANRSAILFHLSRYSSCLDDIQAALAHEYALQMRYKLEERQARCHLAMEKANTALKFFEAASASLQFSDLDEKKRIQFQKELDKNVAVCKDIVLSQTKSDVCNLSNGTNDTGTHCALSKENGLNGTDLLKNMPEFTDPPNHAYPSLSSAANVTYANDRGRFIVAARDIYPGDVILIERPYASVLLPERYYDHCRRCYRQTLTLVPCNYCASALYCCVDCRSSDLQVHARECRGGLLEILRLSGVDKFAFLAVRSIATMSSESLFQLRSSLNASKHVKGEMGIVENSVDTTGEVYEWNDYGAICRLVTNAEMRSAHDLFRRGIIAVYLLKGLQHAGYFENHKLSAQDDLTLMAFVGGLLLSHLQSYPCNAHEISEFVLDPAAVSASEPCELGAGIYATLSLFNHSCDPVVTRSFFGDTCVVRAIRTARAGEELSDNYGAVFPMQTRKKRHDKLAPQYYFNCRCDACLGDWPLYDVSLALEPIWRCSRCRISPLSAAGVCSGCELSQSTAEKLEILKSSHLKYKTAFQLLLAGDARAALPTFLEHLRVIDELCCRPYSEYCSCQEAVKHCFSMLSNCCLVSCSK